MLILEDAIFVNIYKIESLFIPSKPFFSVSLIISVSFVIFELIVPIFTPVSFYNSSLSCNICNKSLSTRASFVAESA